MLKRLLILSLFFAIVIAACSKKDEATPTGTLTITAQDSVENAIDSITFTLYADQATYNSKTNPIATMMGDANGTAVFTGITKDNLWVRAVKEGVWSNAAGGASTNRNLTGVSTSGATSRIILVKDVRRACVRGNGGFLSIVNTTENVYDIFLVGQTNKVGTLAAGESSPISFGTTGLVPVGNYTFNFTRTSGTTGAASISKPVSITQCNASTISIP
jgi:hypothetical protein